MTSGGPSPWMLELWAASALGRVRDQGVDDVVASHSLVVHAPAASLDGILRAVLEELAEPRHEDAVPGAFQRERRSQDPEPGSIGPLKLDLCDDMLRLEDSLPRVAGVEQEEDRGGAAASDPGSQVLRGQFPRPAL